MFPLGWETACFYLYMLRCLNPKKAHDNRGSFARPVPSGKTVALSATAASEAEETGEEQVACQYCKYLLAGAVLGDCRIIRWIGSGAFGDVYEAEQLPPLSRRVAIKVMAIERVVDGESAEMFAREVSTIAALDHPNILPVLRVGMIDDGRPYLVMKYAALGSLQQFCQPASPVHSANTPSLVPTIIRASVDATPAHDLAVISAETLNMAEVGASTAGTTETPDEAADGLLILEVADEISLPEQGDSEDGDISDAGESVSDLHTGSTIRRETGHLEIPSLSSEGASAGLTEEHGQRSRSPVMIAGETAVQVAVLEVTAEAEVCASEPLAAADAVLSPTDEERAVAHQEVPVVQPQESALLEEQLDEIPQTPVEPLAIEDVPGEATDYMEALPEESQNGHAREVEQISTLILADQEPSPVSPVAASPRVGSVAPLSLQQVLSYVEQAADALYYAHQRGLIHLDVKPANLLLDAQGRLMLADFGVSVLLEGYTHASLHYYVGTPLYTAPEQWLEQPRTASDQYALAVTCYQLLTGRPPFTGNLYAVMHGHLQAAPAPMSEFNPLIPAPIESVIGRALAKDPTERYPDIRAFAQAFREAIENAASAHTDTQMLQRSALLLEEGVPAVAIQDEPSSELVEPEYSPEDSLVRKKMQPEVGTFRAQRDDGEAPVTRRWLKPAVWLRNLLLCVLAVLLIAGGSLGFVRSQRPCWLGICPQIMLSTHALTLTNDATQIIEITNTGTDNLNWTATSRPRTPWLLISPTSGTLAPGGTGKLLLKTNVDDLALDPRRVYTYTTSVDISGGPGVVPQAVEVTENVAKGLSSVSVTTSGKSFLYEQGKLQPGKQKITITNHSGHTLNWFSQYTDNNWLSVTPSQGSLKDQKSIDLTVTVDNLAILPTDNYQVRFSLVGQLDNQPDFTLLQTIDFSLQVRQSQIAQVAPTVPAVAPTTPSSLAFTAQPVEAGGAPDVLRFNHSMVWDTQDDELLIFGGSNDQGDLLNDLWSFNPAHESWDKLISASSSSNDCDGNSPSPRMSAAMVWDSADQEVLLYGGIGRNNTYLGDLWAFSPSKGNWKVLACSGNAPGARGAAGVVWTGSQMLLLGGKGSGGSLADFWAYTPGSGGGWSQLAASTPLGARTYPAISWDSHGKQLFVFGGLSATGQPLGDFYAYQPDSGWRTIKSGNGIAPMARQQAFSTWDSKQRVFLLMGGWQASTNTTYSALWAYSPDDNAWWQITSLRDSGNSSVIPSRMASVMVWDTSDNRAYIYAGSSSGSRGAMNDLWMIAPN